MALRRVDESPSEAERSEREWCGSRFQVRIHNLLFEKLERARETLENSDSFDTFQKNKLRIELLKEVIGLIHEHDTDSCKKTYGLK